MALLTTSNFAGKAAGFYISAALKAIKLVRLLNYDRKYQVQV